MGDTHYYYYAELSLQGSPGVGFLTKQPTGLFAALAVSPHVLANTADSVGHAELDMPPPKVIKEYKNHIHQVDVF